jgi:hypothetical protein
LFFQDAKLLLYRLGHHHRHGHGHGVPTTPVAAINQSILWWQSTMAALQTYDIYVEYESMAYANETLTMLSWIRPFDASLTCPLLSSSSAAASGLSSSDSNATTNATITSHVTAGTLGMIIFELCRDAHVIARGMIRTHGPDMELHSTL